MKRRIMSNLTKETIHLNSVTKKDPLVTAGLPTVTFPTDSPDSEEAAGPSSTATYPRHRAETLARSPASSPVPESLTPKEPRETS